MNQIRSEMHPLLSEPIIQALKSKRVFTVSQFIKTDSHLISKHSRLNFKEILLIKKALLKHFSAQPVNGFADYTNILKNTAIIPTGINSVDQLLQGGLLTGNIYEICGLPACGKTQFALSVTKNLLLQNNQQHVYFLDTKNDFLGQKIYNMFNNCDEKMKENYLSRILAKRLSTRYDLLNSLYEIKNMFENGDLKLLRLIIIDSMPMVVRQLLDITKNNSFLNYLADVMRFIAIEYHVAFLIVNLVTTWVDNDCENKQTSVETIGCGKFWCSIPNIRLKIEKNTNKLCNIIRIDNNYYCNNFALNSSVVEITNEGLRDASELLNNI